jgi:hypothetical protein
VPVDLIVYTEAEWRELSGRGDRFANSLNQEAIWVFIR